MSLVKLNVFARLSRCYKILLALLCLSLLTPAHAVYVQRYGGISNGAITFTGNTLGLDKASNANAPGVSGGIGTFISLNTTLQDGTFPAGTTSDWTRNGSAAQLTLPAGSTVLYAELIWTGSYSYAGENVSAFLNNPIGFQTPSGTVSVTPSVATAQSIGTGTTTGTCSAGPCFYVRSADVTALVRAGGAGTYAATGVPATQGTTENNSNNAGWTLAVVYQNSSLPSRSLSLFVGAERGGDPAATVSGFCTPPTGQRSGRLLVSASEGDAGISGDQMQFGPNAASLSPVSGPRNSVSNFFAGQINNDSGNLNTTGTFGTSNHNAGAPVSGSRQGFDITNVDISSQLVNNQTSAAARGTTTGDQYLINALALQINVGSPIFPVTTKTVDRSVARVGDTLTYTVTLDNGSGTADATNLVLRDPLPVGLSFVAGSLTVDGVSNLGNIANLSIGTVAAGAQKTVRFQARVDSIPNAPSAAQYDNSASWDYQFISCAGQPTSFGSITTNPATTRIARLALTKQASPSGTVNPRDLVTYTITARNDGTADSSGSTLVDAIPAGTTYVPNSTTLNGVNIPDNTGAMPFVTQRSISNAGQAPGIVQTGQAAVVSFSVRVNSNATGILSNTATADVDGSAGRASSVSATATNPIGQVADLSVLKTGPTALTPNGSAIYSIVISNAGPSAANGATLADTLPADMTLSSAVCASASGGALCPASLNTTATSLSAVIATLPSGGSVSFTVTVQLAGSATGTRTNTATIAPPTGVIDPNLTNNTSSTVGTINPVADLVMTKTGPATAAAGTAISYRLAIRNDGPSSANGAAFSDVVPSNISGVSASCSNAIGGAVCPSSVLVAGNAVSGSIPTLPAGGSVVITIDGTISGSATGTLSNTASVTTPTGTTDPNTTNSTSTATTNLDRVADVSIVKSGASTFVPGSSVSYALVIRNGGPSPADGTSFTDNVPSQLTGVAATCSNPTGGAVCPGSVSVVGNLVSGTLSAMPAGSSVTITITGTVSASATGVITNSASTTVPSGVTDPDTSNNASTTSGAVNASSDLSIVKTAAANANAGSLLTYTLVLRNNGPSDVFNASFVDNSPTDLNSVSASCVGTTGGGSCPSGFAITGTTVSGTIPVFPVGASVTLQITGTISGSSTGSITNAASIATPASVPDNNAANNTSAVTTVITPVANLRVVKTSAASVAAGTGIVYNLVISNAGPSPANAATFTDVVPSTVSGLSASCSLATAGAVCPSSVSIVGNTVSGSVPQLPAGSSVTITIAGTVAGTATGAISNTASVTSPSGVVDPDLTDNSSTTVTPINAVADVRIVKLAPTSVNAGASLTFQLVVSNLGPSSANNTSYTDSVSSVLSGLSASCASASGGAVCSTPSVTGNSVSGTIASLPAGGQIVVNVTGIVSGSATGSIANTATVTTAGGVSDPDTSNNTSTTLTSVTPVANLKMVKLGPSVANAGSSQSYTLTISNTGPSRADGSTFTDTLPANLSLIGASCSSPLGGAVCPSSLSVVGNTVSGSIPSLPNAGSVVITVNALVNGNAVGSVVNTASVTPPAGTFDPDTNDNTSSISTAVVPVADVSIVKVGPSSFTPNSSISYSVTVRNAGPSAANNTRFDDLVPSSISAVNASCVSVTGGALCPSTVAVAGNSVSAIVATLPSGSSVTFTINGTVLPSATGTISNTASLTLPSGLVDPDPSNNSSTASTPVVPTADLSIVKTAPTSATPGAAISFQLVITNAGPSSANGTTFSDTVPGTITGISAVCSTPTGGAICPSGALVAGNVVSGTIPTLPSGGSVRIIISGTIIGSASGSISNSASLSPPAGTIDPSASNNSSTSLTNLTPTADLAVTKVKLTPAGNLVPGQAVQYLIELTSAGPSNVIGASLLDALPTGLASMTWSCGVTGNADCDSSSAGMGASGAGGISLTNINLEAGAANKISILVNGIVANSAVGTVSNSVTVATPSGTIDPNLANNTASSIANVSLTADVTVSKVGPTSINAGSTISYTITVANAGPSSADGVVFTDNVPVGIVGVSAACGNPTSGAACPSAISISGNTVSSVIPTLPAGATVQMTVSGTVSGTAPSTITNTASVTLPATIADPTPSNNSSAATTVVPVADLSIVKSGPSAITAGSTISYSIVVRNAGPSAALNSLFTDAVPLSISGLIVNCANETNGAVCPTTISLASNNVSAVIAQMPSGSSLTFTVVGTVSGSATGVLSNTASIAVAPGTIDPDSTNNSSTETTSITPTVDLSIVKSAPANANAGGAISFDLLISNAGPSAADDTAFSDVVPSQITGVSALCVMPTGGAVCPGSISVTGNSVNGVVPTLPSGGSITIRISGTVLGSATGSITNTARVTPAAGIVDSTPLNNQSQSTTAIALVADLRAVKSAPAAVQPLQTISYTVVVSNVGPSAVANADFTDNVPSSITNVQASCSAPTAGAVCPSVVSVVGNAVTTTIPTLPSGGSVTLTVSGQVIASATGVISNTATITAPVNVTDPVPANNSSTATTGINAIADLTIVKSGPTNAQVGSTITYNILVSNAGPSDAGGTAFTDLVPSSIGSISTACSVTSGSALCPGSFALSGNSVSGTIPLLPAGSSVTVSITGVVQAAATGAITNTATLTPPANVIDSSPNNTSSVTTSITPVANLSIQKNAPPAVNAGAGISYQLIVRNAGPSAANGSQFNDQVPASISNVAASCTSSANGATCPSISVVGNTVSGTFANLPNGGEAIITITGNVVGSTTGVITNTATLAVPVGHVDPDPSNNTSSALTPVSPVADVVVTKTAVASVNAGALLTYNLRIQNNGPSAANDTVLSDSVPVSLQSVSASCGGVSGGAICPSTVGVSGNNVSATIPTLPAGGVAIITITGTVAGNAPSSISNTANVAVASGILDPNPANNVSTVATTVQPVADLRVTKTGPASANAGSLVTYSIVAINTGPSAANGATIIDNVPSSITGVVATCVGATGGAVCPTVNVVGNSVSATLATLPAGATLSFSVQGTVAGGALGSITNSVSITAPVGVLDPDLTNNTALSNSPVQPVADVRIAKIGPTSAQAGGPITWQIQVFNDGPSAANLTSFSDTLPNSISSVAATCSATSGGALCPASVEVVGNTVSGSIATLPAGSSVTFNVSGVVVGSTLGSIVNSATVNVTNGIIDPNALNNTATSTTAVNPVADVSVTKTGPAAANAGASVTYNISVENAGPSIANGTNLVDALPPELLLGTATCVSASGGAICPSVVTAGNTMSAVIATLPAGSRLNFVVNATVVGAATGNIVNSAVATLPTGTSDPSPTNNTGTATTPVTPVADLMIEKSAVAQLNAADPITYIIKVTNLGPSRANNSLLSDNVPVQIGSIAASCASEILGSVCPSNVDVVGNAVSAVIPSMPAGSSMVFTLRGTLSSTASGNVINTATISPAAGVVDPTLGNNSSSASTIVTPLADLSISKRRVQQIDNVQPGMPISYDIVVRNAGPAPASGVSVTDTMPASLVNVTWTCVATGAADCDTAVAGTGSSGNGSFTLPNIMINGGAANFVTIRVEATVAPNAQFSVTNTATLAAPASIIDPNLDNNVATDSVAVSTSIRGQIWADTNADTTRQSGEVGLGGLSVTLTPIDGGTPIVVVTNSLGEYIAPVAPSVRYTLRVTAPSGLVATTRNNPQVVVGGALGEQTSATPIGLAPGATLSGSVWRDVNHDRNRNSGELGVGGFRVEVLAAGTLPTQTGTVLASALTDANGNYSIADLIPSNPNDVTTRYTLRFVDPFNNVLYAKPVSRDPVNPNGSTDRGLIEGLQLAPGVNQIEQNLPLDPSGVIYDSSTRRPLQGAVVSFSGPTGFDAAIHLLGGVTAASQTTGPNGYYEFWLLPNAPAGVYSLSVVAPTGYTAPSTQIIVQPGTLDSTNTGNVLAVQPQADPPAGQQDTRYFQRFNIRAGADHIVNNHIPLDPEVAANMFVTKSANKSVADIGDVVRYTISLRHLGGPATSNVRIIDTLPPGFRYVPGTSRLQTAVNQPAYTIDDPLGGVGPNLSFSIARLELNQTILLTYAVRLAVGAQQGDGINRAFAQSGNTRSNLALAKVKVESVVFTQQACVLGKVFIDCNGNQIQDGEELGIPGIRLFTQDGTFMVTDVEGKYSYCGLRPNTYVLKVDPSTLPTGSRLTTTSNRNGADANSLFLDPKFGETIRADFAEGSCKPSVVQETKDRKKNGEVRAPAVPDKPAANRPRATNSSQPLP